MKKILSLFLAMLFTVTAFGVLVSGVFYTAAAEENTLEYTQIPGFSAFSEEELEKLQNPFASFSGFSDERKMANFTVEKTDSWGRFVLATCEDVDCLGEPMSPWNGKASIGGKDIFGETGASFAYADGVKFTVNKNGEPYGGQVTLYCYQVPAKGPYYDSGELQDLPVGFVYSSRVSSENGEYYFDFEKDFKQEDWWSKDDEGVNNYDQQSAIPNKTLPLINGFAIRLHANEGETISVGNFAICTYKIPRTEKLDEQIMRYRALDKSAYSKESYANVYETYLKINNYDVATLTKADVIEMTRELKNAIDALEPLFLIKDNSTDIVGFEVWDDSDLKIITDAGFDTAEWFLDFDEPVIAVGARSVNNGPNYGYSWFSSAVTVDDEIVAVKNPFEALSPDNPLSKAAGIRFHLKWGEELADGPIDELRVAVGSSADDKFFDAVIPYKELPENEGDIAVSWGEFKQVGGTGRISPYIDSLDYIGIYIENAVGVYYVSDLSAAKWSYSAADIDDLVFIISEAFDYMSPLDKSEYHYKSWDRAIDAIIKGVAISNKYGVSQKEVDSACEEILNAINKLTFLGDPGIHNLRLSVLSEISYAIDKNTVTPESYQKLMDAVAEANESRYPMYDEAMAACDRIVEMMKALVRADGEEWEVPVVTNISDGDVIDVSNGGFIPVWENGTALLNYMDIPAGTPIYLNGEYTIEVYNGGAVTSVNFTVTGEVSAPVISGVEHGKTYTSVTVSWDHGTGRLNGEAIENGTTIDEDGVYILQVTGVNKESSVVFRIVGEDNKLSGDLDGDGEVTVSDALIALRVTARISQPDGNILQLADLDGDGEISVSDALAILKIAAGII